MHHIFALTAILVTWKWGDWRNWEKYYPTILYFIIGDLTYNFLVYNKPLWSYESTMFNHTLIDILITFTVFPCVVLLFIPHMPKGLGKQTLYIMTWTALALIIEVLLHAGGWFSYHNGWNLGWSVVHDVIMFMLIWLHYIRPLWVWPMSIIIAFAILAIFNIPFSSMK